jgi:hypothetical protein
MTELEKCPHCGESPSFEGSASNWKDDNRYVELSLTCCATMTEAMGWRQARELTVAQRTEFLKERLTKRWNTRVEAAPTAVGEIQGCNTGIIQRGHYFQFERGEWVKDGDKPTRHYGASGPVYAGHLTRQQRDELDALIDGYLKNIAAFKHCDGCTTRSPSDRSG